MVKKKVKKTIRSLLKSKPPRKSKVVVLPDKMSELITLALKDLKKAEKSKKHVIDMGSWYNPKALVQCKIGSDEVVHEYKACAVCFAGSVMAFSLNAKMTDTEDRFLYGKDGCKFQAINYLRDGDVRQAAALLNIDSDNIPDNLLSVIVPDYEALKPKPFHDTMQKLAADLKRVGL